MDTQVQGWPVFRNRRSCLLPIAMVFGIAGHAQAQEAQQIPLIVTSSRLLINIGVDGNSPVPYLFDTGSTNFIIDVGTGSPAWFPNVTGQQALAGALANNTLPLTDATLPAGIESALYGTSGGENGYLVSSGTVSSIQFAGSAGQPVTYSLSNASQAGYQVGTAIYFMLPRNGTVDSTTYPNGIYQSDNVTYYPETGFQSQIDASRPPEEGVDYGTFGAGDFIQGGLQPGGLGTAGSVLGNLTNTGYVVEANGEQNAPGGCGGACLIIGLTDALRAQFFTTVPWTGTSGNFPISQVSAATQFSTIFNYVLAPAAGNLSSDQLMTLLDTGDGGIDLNSATLRAQAIANGSAPVPSTPTQVITANPNQTLEITGVSSNPESTTTTAIETNNGTPNSGSDNVQGEVDLYPSGTATPPDGSAIAGLPFFAANAVLYDLANRETGYTPFYVTVAPLSNGLTISSADEEDGIAGVISGANGVTINAGDAYLTAANDYTGATTVAKAGWLGVGGPGSIADSSNVNLDGTLDLFHSTNSTGQFVRSLSGNGTIILGPTTLTLTAADGDFAGSIGNVYASGGAPQPYPMPTTSPGGYGGVIIAGGTETFSGDDTYAGNTGIGEAGGLILAGSLENSGVANAGYFQNDGTAQQMTVSTGTITGNGNFAGGLVAANGLVSPGDPGQALAGHITVGTSLSLGSGATYLVRASGTQASRIDVGGPATIEDSTLAVIFGSKTQPAAIGQSYTILTALSDVAGQFGNLESNLATPASAYPFLGADLDQTPTAISIDVSRSGVPFTAAAQTRNQYAVASGLDSMNPLEAVPNAVASLNFQAARPALNALAGDLHPSIQTSLIQNSYEIGTATVERLRATECIPGGADTSMEVANYAGQKSVQDGGCHEESRAVWMQAFGAWGDNSNTSNASGLRSSTGGFVLGADTPVFINWHLGGLFAYGHTGFSAVSTSASGHSDDASLGVYGGRHWKNIGLRLGAIYSWNAISTERDVAFPGFHDRVNSDYGGGTAQAFAELGYHLMLREVMLEPFGNVAYVNQYAHAFNETGPGGAALQGSSRNLGVTFTTFGARLVRNFTLAQCGLESNMTLGYRHAFGPVTPTTYENFEAGGGTFETAGVPVAQNAAIIEAGLQARLSSRLKIGIAYVGQYGSAYTQSGIQGDLRWSF